MLHGVRGCYTVLHGVTRCKRVLHVLMVFHGVTGCYGGGFRNRGPGGRAPLVLDQTYIRGAEKFVFWRQPPPNFISRSGSVTVFYGVTKGYMVLHGLKGRYTVAHGVTR